MLIYKSGYFFGDAAKLWWIFILAGIFALISPYIIEPNVSMLRILIIGIISIVVGTLLKLNFSGPQIDENRNRIRNFTAVMGIKTGVWQDSPEFKKITLTSSNVISWNTPNGISPTFKSYSTLYTIALSSNAENPDFFIQTDKKKKALVMAKQFSDLFGVAVETDK